LTLRQTFPERPHDGGLKAVSASDPAMDEYERRDEHEIECRPCFRGNPPIAEGTSCAEEVEPATHDVAGHVERVSRGTPQEEMTPAALPENERPGQATRDDDECAGPHV